jgi:hypothetical protein
MTFVNQKKSCAAAGLMLAICLGSIGCESTVSLERHWIGKSKQSLLTSWGQPTRIVEGPEGEAVYIYTRTYYPDYQDTSGAGGDTGVYTPSGDAMDYPIRVNAESSTAKFWISPQGTIYRAEGRILE